MTDISTDRHAPRWVDQPGGVNMDGLAHVLVDLSTSDGAASDWWWACSCGDANRAHSKASAYYDWAGHLYAYGEHE